MSDSNNLRSSNPRTIPVKYRDGYLDPRDLSTTPGGTIYATTPGGTRIVYDKDSLLQLQHSPLSKSPINANFHPELFKISGNETKKPTTIKPHIVTKEKETDGDHSGQDLFKMD